MSYEIPKHHKTLMPGHTLEECYDLLAEAVNQMSGDCDPEKCVDGYHAADCEGLLSHVTIINQQKRIAELESALREIASGYMHSYDEFQDGINCCAQKAKQALAGERE